MSFYHNHYSNIPSNIVLSLVGASKSGKSTLVYNLLCNYFHSKIIYFYSPNVLNDEKKDEIARRLPKNSIIRFKSFIPNPVEMTSLISLPENKNSTYVFDDFSRKELSALDSIVIRIRHFGSCIISTQSFANLTPVIRSNTHVFGFTSPMSSQRQKQIYDEYFSEVIEKKQFEDAAFYCFKYEVPDRERSYNFLIIDRDNMIISKNLTERIEYDF